MTRLRDEANRKLHAWAKHVRDVCDLPPLAACVCVHAKASHTHYAVAALPGPCVAAGCACSGFAPAQLPASPSQKESPSHG